LHDPRTRHHRALLLLLPATLALSSAAALGQSPDLSASEAGGNVGTGTAAATPAEGTALGTGEPTPFAFDRARAETALGLAALQADAGDVDAATAGLLAHLAAHPGDAPIAVPYSRQLGARGAFDDAQHFLAAHLEALQRHGRDDPAAAFELGTLLLTQLHFEEAAGYLERVPPDAGTLRTLAQLNLGKAYRTLGRFDEARALYAPLAHGSLGPFVDAELCELDLVVEGVALGRACLERARAAHGGHPTLGQAEALLAYLEGDFEAATRVIDGLYALGEPGGRVQTLRPLVALASDGPAAALEALERMEHVTVRGERDAMTAAALAQAGDLPRAADSYRAAVRRNRLFEDPERAATVLVWRPEVRDALAQAREAAHEQDQAAGTGAPALPGTGAGTTPDPAPLARGGRTGCCATAVGEGTGEASSVPPLLLALALALALLACRDRRLSRRPRPGPPGRVADPAD
jgi:tetratricopeptide (TPR) repeat protein